MNKPSITLKIMSKNGELIFRVRSRKSKRFFFYIQKEDFLDCLFSVCVTYAKGMKNETYPQNREETLFALEAFLEK